MNDLNNIGIPNDSISAIVVYPNTCIVLFQHAGFVGRCLLINNISQNTSLIIRNLADFNFNKELSSCKIYNSIPTMASGVVMLDSPESLKDFTLGMDTCSKNNSQIKGLEVLNVKEGFKSKNYQTHHKISSEHNSKNNHHLLYLVAFIIVLFLIKQWYDKSK